jgi:iron-sulfur cluster assembly accessory protein
MASSFIMKEICIDFFSPAPKKGCEKSLIKEHKQNTMDFQFSVSPKALEHLSHLQHKAGRLLLFRVCVDAGGCSGMKYDLKLEDPLTELSDADVNLAAFENIVVVTDSVSLPFLAEAELDYEASLMEATFVIRNPQAKSSCGCGASFSLF